MAPLLLLLAAPSLTAHEAGALFDRTFANEADCHAALAQAQAALSPPQTHAILMQSRCEPNSAGRYRLRLHWRSRLVHRP